MFFFNCNRLKTFAEQKKRLLEGFMIKDEGLTARTCRKVLEGEINN